MVGTPQPYYPGLVRRAYLSAVDHQPSRSLVPASPDVALTAPEALRPSGTELACNHRLRAGDRSAFEELFRAHYDHLVGYAARVLGATGAAEEVVQDVFLSIWKNRARLELPASNVAAYLLGAVRKRATTHLRHAHVEQRWRDRVARTEAVLPIGHVQAADADTRFNEVTAAVRAAVDELPPRCRQAFLLRRRHGLSYAEIAQVMGIAPKTVEVQIGAALRTLRARLARFYD
jgi:RNA polymerase sigma-70 factor, ECF subfamily